MHTIQKIQERFSHDFLTHSTQDGKMGSRPGQLSIRLDGTTSGVKGYQHSLHCTWKCRYCDETGKWGMETTTQWEGNFSWFFQWTIKAQNVFIVNYKTDIIWMTKKSHLTFIPLLKLSFEVTIHTVDTHLCTVQYHWKIYFYKISVILLIESEFLLITYNWSADLVDKYCNLNITRKNLLKPETNLT